MDNKRRIKKLKGSDYQGLFGVRKVTFDAILAILEGAFEEMHTRDGRPSRLSVLDKLIVTLGYYHDYRTMENIAFDYDVSKSRISDAVKWVEETLIKDGTFALPSKRELTAMRNLAYAARRDRVSLVISSAKKIGWLRPCG